MTIVCLSTGCRESQYNAVLSQGIVYLRVRAGPPGGPAEHWRTLADQFPGRWLLALGHWIIAVKIDTLEAVPPHVAISESRVTKSSDAAGNERVMLHRARHVFDRHVRVGRVLIEEVNRLDPEPLE